MPPTRRSAPRLTDAQLGKMLELVKNADSVELKLTVPSDSHRATIQGLPIDPVEAQPRQVFFFDTPNLDLDKAGLVVRARRIQGGRGIRSSSFARSCRTSCPTRSVRSASVQCRGRRDAGRLCLLGLDEGAEQLGRDQRRALSGALPLRKIFTRSRGRSSRRTPRRASRWTIGPARPDVYPQARLGPEGARAASSWRSSGSTRTARGSSSCPRSACRARRSRSRRRRRAYLSSGRQLRGVPSRRRHGRRSSSSGRSCGTARSLGAVRGGRGGARRAAERPPEPGPPGRPVLGRPAGPRRLRPRRRRPAAGPAAAGASAPTATGRRRATTAATKTTGAGATTRRAAKAGKASTAKAPAPKAPAPKASTAKTGAGTRRTRRPSA